VISRKHIMILYDFQSFLYLGKIDEKVDTHSILQGRGHIFGED